MNPIAPSHCSRLPSSAGGFSPPGAWRRLLSGAFFFLGLALAGNLSLGTAQAQSTTGSVMGRVQNVATGQYLNNARVSVRGTDLVVFTDQAGIFRLVNVPAGPAVIEVYYTGLEPQTIPLEVRAGQWTERDIDLRLRGESEIVALDSFVVTSERETDGEAIAINEQRFADNIKNVVATDSFGDIPEGNIGEFMKFLPGVTVDYVQAAVRTISVRGFADNLTGVQVDGAQMASAASGASTRSFELEQVSLNNVSRIELTKVPTPSTPADSLAGSVNMVSKSAFERKRAQLRYRIYMSANHENLTFDKTPHTFEKYTHKILPGADFDYTLPISKDFGLVITGLTSNQFNEQHLSHMTYNSTNAGASYAAPYLQSHTLQDGPTTTNRSSLSVRADWRIRRNHVISASVQTNYFRNYFGTYNWVKNAGTNANPTVSVANGGVRHSYGPDHTIGATGRGAVTFGGGFRDKMGSTTAGNLRYTFDDGTWKIEAGVNNSVSRTWYRAHDRKHFAVLNLAMKVPVRVTMSQLTPDLPGEVRVYDNNNNEIDIYDINNYRVTTATSNPLDAKDEFEAANLSVRRELGIFSFPAAPQIGGLHRVQTRDIRRQTITWDYAGINGDTSAAPFATQVYRNQDNGYGFRNVPYASPHQAWWAFERDPSLFVESATRLVTTERYRRTNSEYIQEKVSALYLQAEARLLKNRLKVVTGVRFERTEGDGRGPYSDPGGAFLRDANGEYILDADNRRIRLAEAGTVGSMEELNLTLTERGYVSNRVYDGYYPSLHLNYNASENWIVRLAYARTYGRPNFNEIIPSATFDAETDEEDEDIIRNVTLRNPGLMPWTADNYDLSVEYYTPQGGVVSAGVFLKEIKDFFGIRARLATEADLLEFNLPQRYLGWNLSTKFNSGDARITGAEFNVRHPLADLGGIWKYFIVWANATKLKLEGHEQADFNRFIPESANWGFTYNRNPVTFHAKWNYRGKQQRNPQATFGADGREYYRARVFLDLNLDYRINRAISAFISGRNVLNEPQVLERYGSETPAYAKQFRTEEFGIQWVLGIKGTF